MRLIKSLLVFAAIFLAAPAFAHSNLVTANPEENATLVAMPNEVRLEFNEDLLLVGDLNPNKVEVVDSEGKLVSGAISVDKQYISAPIVPGTAPGKFTVKYRVTSADGHPIEGEYGFSVATPEVISAPVEESPAEDGPNLLIRVIWGLLLVSAAGTFVLLRRR